MEWWFTGAAVFLLACALPLVWLFLRRRFLSLRGGLFDCGMRMAGRDHQRWALGFGRYEGNHFEWYRALGIALSPRTVLDRRTTAYASRRDPEAHEALELFAAQQIVRLRTQNDQGSERVLEFSMDPGSLTGLLSWLEAAPPGGGRYPGVE